MKEMEGYELEGKTLKCMLATVQKGGLAAVWYLSKDTAVRT